MNDILMWMIFLSLYVALCLILILITKIVIKRNDERGFKNTIICPECKGLGVDERTDELFKCEYCKGNGRIFSR